MATLTKYKEVRTWGVEPEWVDIPYSFALDTGAVAFYNAIKTKEASVITQAKMVVNTTCTSGGSATVSMGKSTDVAGLVAATAVASLTAGAVILGNTYDQSYVCAADDLLGFDIAVAALTAGAITFSVGVLKLAR